MDLKLYDFRLFYCVLLQNIKAGVGFNYYIKH